LKNNVLKVLSVASIVFSVGCASIINDKTQSVSVRSSVGSEISGSIDGIQFKGPVSVPVTRAKADKVIVVDTPNCANQTVLESSVSPAFFGNIIFGGLLGSSTDYSTEKMWSYDYTVIINCQS